MISLAIVIVLYIPSRYNQDFVRKHYLLFHSLAELFSIVVAWSIFALVWHSRQRLDNSYLVLLGVAYLFVGTLDLIHTLAYPGMGVFAAGDTNLAAQLWVAARYLESLSLLVAPLLFGRRLRLAVPLVAYGAVSCLLLLCIFQWQVFPTCFVDRPLPGQEAGLTGFKIGSEYAICLILAAAAVLLLKNRRRFDRQVVPMLAWSIVITVAAELAFTLYKGPYGPANLIGHFFKIVSFYFIYRAIIQTGLVKPQVILYRNLKRSQEALQNSRDELEQRVRERTAELTQANLALQQEISERQQAEEALREQSGVLEAFFKHTIAPLVFLDKEFNFVRVNEAYAKACQRDVSEFPGHNHFEFYPSEAKAIFEEVVRTKAPYHAVAKPFCFPDHPEWGVTYWDWFLVPILDGAGEVEFLVFSLEDVTQRKRAQDEVESERQRLYSVLNVLPGYVAIVTADHAIRFANHRFLNLFGEPGENPCYVVQRRRSKPCENCPVLEILDSRRPQEWEWTDPDARTYRVWGYPFPNPDGTLGVLQLGIDITERKELEQEVLEISEIERQRIGHDLHDTVGQNLTGAAFLSRVLGDRLAERQAPEAAQAVKIEELLNRAIVQTRSVARGLSPVRMDADGLVPAIMEMASSIEKVYGIRCTVDYSESVSPTDNVVATHLYRIIQEAVNNAMKHGKAKNVHIALRGDDHKIRLTIQDDGVGMPQDVDESKGIGLRIMRYRAGMIGASLRVGAQPGGGTVVECSLRLLRPWK